MMVKYQFTRTGEGLTDKWFVSVSRKAFKLGRVTWRDEIVLGAITLHARLVDTEFELHSNDCYGGNPEIKAEAMALLRGEVEGCEMWAQFMRARESYHHLEQVSGKYHLKIGTEESRWHTAQRAREYAQERLTTIWQRGLQAARRSETSRSDNGLVIEVFEINEYGKITSILG
jgi:hypothetical protein